ncbi:MAG: GBS Bsp-like repeat-containing protein [Clostridia bacterium]|nr:GBS Bsp-like repeat-containing protein [Clostridia bacterium]
MKKKIRVHTSLLLALSVIVIALCAAAPRVSALITPYGSVSSGSLSDEKVIWDYFMIKINNAYGVAGLMGNLYAESKLKSNNLQDSYESSLHYSDNTYTKAVDEGTYKNFTEDGAGYGLAQWTTSIRKVKLYDFIKSRNVSIADFGAQLDFLNNELNVSYPSVISALKSAKSIREASTTVLKQFESPADQSWSVQETRASYSQKYYDRYVNSPVDTTVDDVPPVISGVTVSNVNSYGFTLTFNVTDNTAVYKASVPVWSEKNGKDDICWHTPVRNGNSFTLTVDTSDHNFESGLFNAQIYAYDVSENITTADVPAVRVPSMHSGTVVVTSKIMLTAINGDQWANTGAYLWTEGTFKAVWWRVLKAERDGRNYKVTAIYNENTGSKSVDPPSGGVLIAVHVSDKSYDAASKVKVGDHFIIQGVTGNVLSSGAYAGFGELMPPSYELVPVSGSGITIENGNILSNVPQGLTLSAFFGKFEDYDEEKKVYNINNSEITTGYVGTGSTVKIYDDDGNEVKSYKVKLKGDIDGDGRITATDYLKVRTMFKSPSSTLRDIQKKAADINEDGRYTVFDYIAIKRVVSGTYRF